MTTNLLDTLTVPEVDHLGGKLVVRHELRE